MEAPEEVAIFFDGSNLYRATKRLCGNGKLHILKLQDFLAGGRAIVHCEYWTAPLVEQVDPARYAQQRRFFAWLEKHLVLVRLGRQVRQGGRWVEKGVDMGLAGSMILFELTITPHRPITFVLVSGDGDFANIVRYLRSKGHAVEVVSIEGHLSHLYGRQPCE